MKKRKKEKEKTPHLVSRLTKPFDHWRESLYEVEHKCASDKFNSKDQSHSRRECQKPVGSLKHTQSLLSFKCL